MKQCLFIIFSLLQITTAFAAQKMMVCTLKGLKDNLILPIPHKTGNLPKIDFPYPVDTAVFVMREGNLLVVAMDQEEKTRPRIFISAQAGNNNTEFKGQFMTDSGGNELQLDNGPVFCKLK
ncbi:hypothetical protein ACNVED_12970 [Legionella sp. D16C41]|uniref:hypothetical protein n=1 Tax=Legionella sp. D16C41 TaxID=3402688 RepID=UPI003AF8F5D3